MAETSPIAEIAALLSKELFRTFYWQTNNVFDQNWPCVHPTGHLAEDIHDGKPPIENANGADAPLEIAELAVPVASVVQKKAAKKAKPKKTHPSDVVFYYDEPYVAARTYVNCDLKSYAAGSITASSVRKALYDLAMSLSCSEKSEEWRKLYIHDGVNAEIVGLLFVYNHDESYDAQFDEILSTINKESLEIPKGSRLIVLGPKDIRWLNNVHRQISYMRGIGELPPAELCRFHYPNLVLKKIVQDTSAATLEILTGPWMILKHRETAEGKEDVLVFYKGKGETTQEFLHLIDYLMYYQLIDKGVRVRVRTLETVSTATAMFSKAIDEYVSEVGGGVDIKKHLHAIEYSQVNAISMNFSLVELGMRHG